MSGYATFQQVHRYTWNWGAEGPIMIDFAVEMEGCINEWPRNLSKSAQNYLKVLCREIYND